jgi:phosphoadenosine phosphosulfate reductase
MLIKCDRHTKQDLELWEEYEEIDLLYYETHNMKEKEQKAIKIIQEFNPDYISISWGKDSVVLAHLCYRAGIYNYAHFTHKADALYFENVRNEFLRNYKINYKEFFKDIKSIINEFFSFHENKISKQASLFFGKKYITGIRIEESAKRKITVMANGVISKNSCRPLAYWSEKEIFAYLAFYNLPIHPNYAMLGSGRFRREKLRVGPHWMGVQHGNELWEKEYYQDILNRLEAQQDVAPKV